MATDPVGVPTGSPPSSAAPSGPARSGAGLSGPGQSGASQSGTSQSGPDPATLDGESTRGHRSRARAGRRDAQGRLAQGRDRATEGDAGRLGGLARRSTGGDRPDRRKRKVRKVHRVVRHVEVWSVFKLSTALTVCGYLVGMISGYLLWRAADRVGTISGIEGFFEDAGGYDTFEILGDVVFRAAAIIGLLLSFLTVFTATLAAVLFNLISDLTGGIRMTVIDEDLIVAPARRAKPPSPPDGASGPPGPPGPR